MPDSTQLNNYILKQEWDGCPAGTRLFFQDNVFFYKTPTEEEKWIDVKFVREHPEIFREVTAVEFFHFCEQINIKEEND